MTDAATHLQIKGWCPGALRPMPSGDGLVVRVRVTAGRLPASLAVTLADLATTCGNGRIDLTQRGNLQLRGVSPETLPALHTELAAHHLLDADPAVEARRNLVVSPLAKASTLALARALEAAVVAAADLAALPAKFAFVIDDGTWPRPAGIGFDLAFVCRDGAWHVDVPTPAGPLSLGRIAPARIAIVAVRLARAFLAQRDGARRMADFVAEPGAAARLAAADGFDVALAPYPPAEVTDVIGLTQARGAVLGVGAPFGQIEAAQLALLADIAGRHGAGELRLTPFRAVLIPAIRDAAAATTLLAAAGLVVDPADPRRAVVACTGAPACTAALQPARIDAALLAAWAATRPGAGVKLHVSACAKGCARPGATALTLVGTEAGYDLVRDGTTRDQPTLAAIARGALADTLANLERP